MCGQSLSPDDLYILDPELHSRLCKLSAIAAAHALVADSAAAAEPESLLFDGCPISDLGLTFTVPGYENVEMMAGGSNVEVKTLVVTEIGPFNTSMFRSHCTTWRIMCQQLADGCSTVAYKLSSRACNPKMYHTLHHPRLFTPQTQVARFQLFFAAVGSALAVPR